jgi:hypothetical protein
MHVLILGITETGKTTLAFRLASSYREQGVNVLVLDPDRRREWGATFITDDPDEFLRIAKLNTKCALFVDESGVMIGRYSGAMQWLATNARKWGHKAHFIAQRATQLDPLIRTQCTVLYLFRQSPTDAKILSNDFVVSGLEDAAELPKGHYLFKNSEDRKARKGKLW